MQTATEETEAAVEQTEKQTETSKREWTSTAGPRQNKAVNEALGAIGRESRTYTELTGVIGGEERSFSRMNAYGGGRQDCLEALRRIAEKFNFSVTSENYQLIVAEAEKELSVLIQNRPVTDKRETPEAVAARRAAVDAREREREEKAAAWRALFCQSEQVDVPEGQMSVCLELAFDNSDMMTDYFDSHCTVGEPMLLGTVAKGSRTEARAQSIVQRYPELLALTWKWDKDRARLVSGHFAVTPEQIQGRRKYGGRHEGPIVDTAHYLIEFRSGRKEWAYKNYRAAAAIEPVAATTAASVEGATIKVNNEKDGIEIHFTTKPSAAVLDQLHANGWRWARRARCWYTRRSDAAMEFARQLIGA